MEWQTLFSVRATFDGPALDSCISWPKVEDPKAAPQAAVVAARLDGKRLTPEQAIQEVYPDAYQACKALPFIDLRTRLGHCEGPYLVTSEGDEAPADEILIEWWKRNRNERFRG